MTDTNFRSALVVGMVFLLALGTGIAAPASAQLDGPYSQDSANSTQTTTDTGDESSDEATCDPGSDEPNMEQARLYAPEKTIDEGSPGEVAGGFQVDPTAECPAVVHITMSVPSGMTIEGASDIFSSGAGMVTATFEVPPQGGVKDIAASVFSTNTGDRTVTADITYWPKGHEDMSKEIDGMSFTFDVVEPVEAGDVEETNGSNQTTDEAGGDGGDTEDNGLPVSTNVMVILGLMSVLALAVLAMTRMSPRDINIGVKK
ncbi:hypothetical protein NGM10_05675 [Halorussus salilacus]|uniref:hypothetical protein n=1 Tax=Halorussus salilacus TaxID=2953750 RepID=UPI0020A140BA|nr:hypothetical protein [Halorussus salilacus]USZ69229.1 hypothetical protein NGM10_05675 [Halorussus salilacus]